MCTEICHQSPNICESTILPDLLQTSLVPISTESEYQQNYLCAIVLSSMSGCQQCFSQLLMIWLLSAPSSTFSNQLCRTNIFLPCCTFLARALVGRIFNSLHSLAFNRRLFSFAHTCSGSNTRTFCFFLHLHEQFMSVLL